MIDGSTRSGTGLSSSSRQDAANAYLQGRLRLFYGVSAVAVVGLYVTMQVADIVSGHWSVKDSLTDEGQIFHSFTALGMTALYFAICWHRFSTRGLHVLDGAGLILVVAGCVLEYVAAYEDPIGLLVVAVLVTFVIARAVVIPSRAKTTFLLSISAPLGILIVQLSHGVPKFVRGVPGVLKGDDHADIFWLWTLVVLLFAVGIATLASRVTFRLRLQAEEAQRMGDYQLEELIGEGGMGEVYRATHAMLRRPTAIKLLRPEIMDPTTKTRFEREVQLTSRLTHPNNIQIYDYGTSPDGVFFYAMELLEGLDLERVVEDTGPAPAGRVIYVMKQACRALAEAHDLGLVHRDIKPSNMVLCRRGGEDDVVKIVDYGIAKDLAVSTSLSQRGSLAGTPEYMPPELIRGGDPSPRSDLYSLGAVAYYLATGWRVFGTPQTGEQLRHHLSTRPIRPSKRLGTVPEDLEAVILRCLAKDATDRYDDMHDLVTALAACDDAGGWSAAQAAMWWNGQGALRAARAES